MHRELGPGFLESIYQQALCLELDARGLSFEREKAVSAKSRDWLISGQRLDLVVGNAIVVLSYLRTTKLRIGLLLNFKTRLLREGIRRIIL